MDPKSRRDELEKKKQRLEQLRQHRASSKPVTDSEDILALVEGLIGPVTKAKVVIEPEYVPPVKVAGMTIETQTMVEQPVVCYSKEIQTDDIPEPEIQIIKVKEPEIIKEVIEEPVVEEIEVKVTQQDLVVDPLELSAFLVRSSKIIERALESYDIHIDYTIAASITTEEDKLKLIRTYESTLTKDRQVTAVDWSPLYPELFVATYNESLDPIAADGLVIIWNTNTMSPEEVHYIQSPVTSAIFHPHLHGVIIGTYSGHIHVLGHNLKAQCHFHPIFSLSTFGSSTATSLVSASTDGVICTWSLDTLNDPMVLETDVAITAMYQDRFGSEDGAIYKMNTVERADLKAGIVSKEQVHSMPVTALGDNFSTSLDWTFKLKGELIDARGMVVDGCFEDGVFCYLDGDLVVNGMRRSTRGTKVKKKGDMIAVGTLDGSVEVWCVNI